MTELERLTRRYYEIEAAEAPSKFRHLYPTWDRVETFARREYAETVVNVLRALRDTEVDVSRAVSAIERDQARLDVVTVRAREVIQLVIDHILEEDADG